MKFDILVSANKLSGPFLGLKYPMRINAWDFFIFRRRQDDKSQNPN